ncbi:hypothetical protein ACP4OV_001825 [Aristida adscensionis]
MGRLRHLFSRPDSSVWVEAVLGARRDAVGPRPPDAGRRRARAVRTLPGGGGDATVLVPGCGAGHDAVALAGAGRSVVGVDISDVAILKAKQEAGPPFNTSVQDYEEVLNPLSFVIASIQDNELAVGPRKGREKIARWKRMTAQPTDLHYSAE